MRRHADGLKGTSEPRVGGSNPSGRATSQTRIRLVSAPCPARRGTLLTFAHGLDAPSSLVSCWRPIALVAALKGWAVGSPTWTRRRRVTRKVLDGGCSVQPSPPRLLQR